MSYDFTDSRPIPRCNDCGAALGDLGFCEECAGRAEEPEPTPEQWAERDADMDEWLQDSDPAYTISEPQPPPPQDGHW